MIAAFFKCVDGGYGWGETGQVCKIVDKSWTKISSQIPGGWKVVEVVGTNEPRAYLEPDYDGSVPTQDIEIDDPDGQNWRLGLNSTL